MGNLIEAFITDTDDPEWLIGEGARDPGLIMRCISDPHRYRQPGYTWDRYYMPHVESATEANDFGGVHTNSSLLNLISWRLHEKGMPIEDEFYFWINVAMAIEPGVDYPLMAKLLPWCMNQLGYDEWLPVLEAAVQETRIAETEAGDVPDGCFLGWCELPESLQEYSDMLSLIFFDPDWKQVDRTWPDVRLHGFLCAVQAGDYQVTLAVPGEAGEEAAARIMAGDCWICMDGNTPLPDETVFTYQEGCAYELPAVSLE